MVLVLLLPLLLDPLLEINHVSRCLGKEGLPLMQVYSHLVHLTIMFLLGFCSFKL